MSPNLLEAEFEHGAVSLLKYVPADVDDVVAYSGTCPSRKPHPAWYYWIFGQRQVHSGKTDL